MHMQVDTWGQSPLLLLLLLFLLLFLLLLPLAVSVGKLLHSPQIRGQNQCSRQCSQCGCWARAGLHAAAAAREARCRHASTRQPTKAACFAKRSSPMWFQLAPSGPPADTSAWPLCHPTPTCPPSPARTIGLRRHVLPLGPGPARQPPGGHDAHRLLAAEEQHQPAGGGGRQRGASVCTSPLLGGG